MTKKEDFQELSKQLENVIGKKDSEKVVSLNQKFTAYAVRFEKEMNKILNPLGFSIKAGVVLKQKGE